MNKMIVIGNLVANPEERWVDTSDGQQQVSNFTVATNRVVHGNKIVNYFEVAVWGKMADNAMKYLAKGSKVYVSGPASARAYIGRDNKPHAQIQISAAEMEFLNSCRDDSGAESPQEPSNSSNGNFSGQQAQNRSQTGNAKPQAVNSDDGFMNIPDGIDEELPFK